MTVRDALIEVMQDVITPQDETSISPSLPVAYLFVTGSTKQKYGYQTTLQLSVGEKTQEKLEELYDDIYAAIGTKATASDDTTLSLIVWDHGQSTVMLDNSWGKRSTLKVTHWDNAEA